MKENERELRRVSLSAFFFRSFLFSCQRPFCPAASSFCAVRDLRFLSLSFTQPS